MQTFKKLCDNVLLFSCIILVVIPCKEALLRTRARNCVNPIFSDSHSHSSSRLVDITGHGTSHMTCLMYMRARKVCIVHFISI